MASLAGEVHRAFLRSFGPNRPPAPPLAAASFGPAAAANADVFGPAAATTTWRSEPVPLSTTSTAGTSVLVDPLGISCSDTGPP